MQPHDIVMYKGKAVETKGCHCHGARILINGKSVAVKNIKLKRYAGACYQTAEQ